MFRTHHGQIHNNSYQRKCIYKVENLEDPMNQCYSEQVGSIFFSQRSTWPEMTQGTCQNQTWQGKQDHGYHGYFVTSEVCFCIITVCMFKQHKLVNQARRRCKSTWVRLKLLTRKRILRNDTNLMSTSTSILTHTDSQMISQTVMDW